MEGGKDGRLVSEKRDFLVQMEVGHNGKRVKKRLFSFRETITSHTTPRVVPSENRQFTLICFC